LREITVPFIRGAVRDRSYTRQLTQLDWEEVQVELGLKSSRATRRRTGSYRKLKEALEGAGSLGRHEGQEGKKV